jgi:transient receptor potential cation channel subfamily A protein 1
MMLGDLDFMNTFVNPHFCDEEKNAAMGLAESCKKGDRKLPHPISSFLMLGIFMVLMPILLMNLLIGLAVGDIESVRRNAQLKRLAMQVRAFIPFFIAATNDTRIGCDICFTYCTVLPFP